MHNENNNLTSLVAEVQNGVEGAFEKLYHESFGLAYIQASMILKNPQDIEDVLQNSYMKVAENIGDLKKPESFTLWLGTIVKHECLRYTEKNAKISDAFIRFRKVRESELESDEYAMTDAVENAETRELVQTALDRLSEKKRMCLVMYYFERNSVAEIAQLTGASEGTVLSRIYYAKKDFEAELKKLRKKDENLFGIAAIPLLVSLFAYQSANITVPSAIEGAVIASVAVGSTAGAATSASAGAAATTSAVTATASGTTAAGSTAAAAVATKIAAVAVAASVATGGGVAVVNHVQKKNEVPSTQSVSVSLTEEHATLAGFVEKTTDFIETTTELYSSTVTSVLEISDDSATEEETETSQTAIQQIGTSAVTVAVSQTKKPRISREYTLEAAKTTALATTVKPTETSTAEQTVTEEETTEEATTERVTTTKPTTTRKETTTLEETTEKPTTTAVPTTDVSEVYGISGGVINEYSGTETKLVIPSKIGSSSVTAIGSGAFEGNSNIKSVSIPSGVTKIGQTAFADCTSLTSISLPSTLTSIGLGAFCGCTSLTAVTVPSGVTSIGDDAFADCGSLSSVTIPSSVTSIGENAFGGCDNITIKCSEESAAYDYAVENSIRYELV